MKRGAENVFLHETEVERDLGVLIDSQLSFKDHISVAVQKANRVLGVIRRTFVNINHETMVFLFKGLIRPILEYGQAAWSPYKLGEQRRLESVQRRATKMIPGFRDLSYYERLSSLKFPTLSHMRRRGDMIDVFKYLTDLYHTSHSLFSLNVSGRTRGHSMKLQKQYARLDVRKYFFSYRVVDLWNSLPENVISATSVNSFKNRLDKFWSNNPSLLYEHV